MSKRKNIPSVGKIIFWFFVFYPLGFYFLFKRIKAKREEESYIYYQTYRQENVQIRIQGVIDSVADTLRGDYNSSTAAQKSGEYRAPSYAGTQYRQEPQSGETVVGRRYKNLTIAAIAAGVLFTMSGMGSLFTGEFSTGFTAIGISLVLLWLGYQRNIKITKYQPYLNYLASFESTYISDIAAYVHKDEITVRSDLADMIGCKMIDAKLSGDGRVILAGTSGSASPAGGTRSAKRTVTCPHCGAPTTMYPGKHNTCEYCGLSIEE